MNSPIESIDHLLPILMDGFLPCQNVSTADKEISTQEIQLSLAGHTGEEFTAKQINDWMIAHDYKERSTNDFQIVWMLKQKDVL